MWPVCPPILRFGKGAGGPYPSTYEDRDGAPYKLKDSGPYYASKMGTCIPGSWDENIALQPADLMAYETLRLIQEKKKGSDFVRRSLQSLFGVTGFLGFYYDREFIETIKDAASNATCLPGGWIPISPGLYPKERRPEK
jgi:hypothetical protein